MKRIKAYFSDLIDLNVGYYDFKRVSKHGLKAWLYKLDKPLNAEQLDYFKQFKNVEFVIVQSQYAPEQKHNGIVLFDKCLPAEVEQ